MLHPQRMMRAVITGLKDDEKAVISSLQGLRCVEIIDYTKDEKGFAIGRPDQRTEDTSKKVIVLRTLIKELELESAEGRPLEASEIKKDMDERLAGIQKVVFENLDKREKIEAGLKSMAQDMKDLEPFVALGLRLDCYREFKSMKVIVGSIGRDASLDMGEASSDSFMTCARTEDGKIYICAFVPNDDSEAVGKLLASVGFQEISVPPMQGEPSKMMADLKERAREWRDRQEKTEGDINSYREMYKDFILAAEELLSAEIERLEAPLRFASSKNSFIADIWIPGRRFEKVKHVVETASGGRAMCIPVKKGEDEDEPIVMNNPRILSPFEGMVKLFSTPKYHEIDPTIIMSIFYPIFFGLMVSDVGFGIVLAIIGVLFINGRTLGIESMASKPALKQVGNILLYGGVIGSILGLLVFGDMFGLPFRAEHEGGLAWNLPILLPSIHIEKLRNIGDLLVLSIIFAGVHMGLGFILGIANNMKHDKKHAMAKFGWLLVLIGLLGMILIVAANRGNRISAGVVGTILFPFKMWTMTLGTMLISIPALALIVTGLIMAVAGEGLIALMEVFTLMSNTFSYGRIAAIGVAEAGLHFGFNSLLLPPMISASSGFNAGSILLIILLAFALMVAQLLVFTLGTLSTGVQSLRLHLFEFFTKFYEGGGREFSPFGKRFKYVKEV